MGGNGLPEFESEQEFQDYLELQLEEEGFTAIQEVRPHNSQYRVDLLLLHDEYGKIGLELKYLTGGTDAADAHRQIVRQYSNKRYMGDRVTKWVFAPYMPKLQAELEHTNFGHQRGKLNGLKHFFQSYGIGVLDVHDSPYCQFEWGNRREYKMPAFTTNHYEAGEISDLDISAIETRARERLIDE